ncbi:MAG TPA: response regulator transcription factor [Spirochaetota bacterium]|jgi:DNA-binding NarL/FixJ family response regulator|nr:response regulator transcription factor [Spirochaetota bacterium]OQA99692.1 MAG: Response regulator UvrY [Spirochaetes bacterium ADurb.Bin218]HOK02039.1 response regulator transcription factor [Spirochaetota bacterium]HOK92295.1 response regulator transcription factor [Spirochaetota bacterium]HON15202.1 response regulator transcription factor [Spirochaetota bacterium]
MIRIVIADDHDIVRAGLKQLIADDPEMEVTGEAKSGEHLIELVKKNDYDVVLLDIKMSGISGIEAIKHIKTIKPNLPIIVLSMHSEDQYAVRTIKAGASGYVTKDSAGENLVVAIKKVASGGKYISPTLAETLAEALAGGGTQLPHESLTDREFQVMCMIASGKTVSEIASELFLSVKTVSTYRQRLLEKMNMKNNSEITHYVIKNNLLDI